MTKQLAGWMLAAVMVAVTAGCSSGGSPGPGPTPSASQSYFRELHREGQLRPVLVACFARHGMIPHKYLDSRWYQHGRVIQNKYWIMWWGSYNGLPVKVNGTEEHLADAARQAAEHGTWPTKLCGPIPSPSAAGS